MVKNQMAKIIKLTAENIEEIKTEFASYLNGKISDGRISFTKNVSVIQRKATVYFYELAYRKFKALVDDFDKEVAWHGIAYRGTNSEKDEYFITDILVYPQEVTGATVTTDQNKYQTWLMNHEDDVFNNIRMQGHSHVNMSVSPSAVDERLYESILSQLDDSMFYIFMIWNKKNDKTCKIYDLEKNVLFDTTDCEIKILTTTPPNVSVDGVTDEEKKVMLERLNEYRYDNICKQFVEDAKKLVVTKTYTPVSSTVGVYNSNSGHGNYGYYGSDRDSYYGGYYGTSKEGNKTTLTKGGNKTSDENKGKRKGRRIESSKYSDSYYGYNEYDDWCD